MTEWRADNCRAPEFPPPSIVDYRPRSTVVAPEHLKPKAKYGAVDYHAHVANFLTSQESLAGFMKQLDSIGVRLNPEEYPAWCTNSWTPVVCRGLPAKAPLSDDGMATIDGESVTAAANSPASTGGKRSSMAIPQPMAAKSTKPAAIPALAMSWWPAPAWASPVRRRYSETPSCPTPTA